jgi:hypothetical protein
MLARIIAGLRRVYPEPTALDRTAENLGQLGTNGDAIMNDEGWQNKRTREDANEDANGLRRTAQPIVPQQHPVMIDTQLANVQQPMPSLQSTSLQQAVAAIDRDLLMGDETAHLKTKAPPSAGPRARGSLKMAKASPAATATGTSAEAASSAAVSSSMAESIMRGVLRSFSLGSVEQPAGAELRRSAEDAAELVTALSNVASDVSMEQDNGSLRAGQERQGETLLVYDDQRAFEQTLPDEDEDFDL